MLCRQREDVLILMIIWHFWEKGREKGKGMMMKDIPDILIDDWPYLFNFSDQLGIYATKAQVHAGEKDTVTLKCRICNTLEHQVSASIVSRFYISVLFFFSFNIFSSGFLFFSNLSFSHFSIILNFFFHLSTFLSSIYLLIFRLVLNFCSFHYNIAQVI